MLTELGRANVFRVTHRDDVAGMQAGNYWPIIGQTRRSRILHDNTTFWEGKNRRGVTEAVYKAHVPGESKSLSFKPPASPCCILAGTTLKIALMARSARDRGYLVQLVSGATLASEEFGLIAGPSAEEAIFLDVADVRSRAHAPNPSHPGDGHGLRYP